MASHLFGPQMRGAVGQQHGIAHGYPKNLPENTSCRWSPRRDECDVCLGSGSQDGDHRIHVLTWLDFTVGGCLQFQKNTFTSLSRLSKRFCASRIVYRLLECDWSRLYIVCIMQSAQHSGSLVPMTPITCYRNSDSPLRIGLVTTLVQSVYRLPRRHLDQVISLHR